MAIPKLNSYNINRTAADYHNRVAWRVDSTRAVLLIHDMQNYFIDFYGTASPIVQQLISNIQQLKAWCTEQGVPVVYTAQPPHQRPADRALLTDFWGTGLTDTDGQHEIVAALAPVPADTCLNKWRYSAFQRSALHQMMHEQKRDQLIVCGVYAHIGILATCMEAFMTDIQAFVVVDAVADFSEEDHTMAARYIGQRCGVVTDLAQVHQDLTAKPCSGMSLEQIRADIANILEIPAADIADDDAIADLGLDSIRLMELIEQWRAAGASIQFADLAELETLKQWWQAIAASSAQDQEEQLEEADHD